MRSRFDPAQAREFRDKYQARWGADLADRVYTSQLLGAEPALVLHGGGNTSVKSRVKEIDGTDVDVLFVKGSGSDLSSIEPAGFPACRLGPLLSYCHLPTLSDEQMVTALRSQMLDPKSPTPSVEALLHAFVPAKFVDHTHADAVLSVVDTDHSAKYCAELFGDKLLFVPYVMPGFVLAQRIVALAKAHPEKLQDPETVMILDKHGIFTWGNTARESYERMIEAVSRAEAFTAHRRATRPGFVEIGAPAPSAVHQRRIGLLVRGAIERSEGGFKSLCSWRSSPEILSLLAAPTASDLTTRGTVTPDHVIRTKPWPALVNAPLDASDEVWTAAINDALADFRRRYTAYFRSNQGRQSTPLTQLDALPRVVAVPGLGVLCLGASLKEAKVAADLYEHTASVILKAESLGGYNPVTAAHLFDVEYWSLEQAKLKLQKTSAAPLRRQVAVVTGAASGIGLVTAEALLEQGAHVMLSDIDEERLKQAAKDLGRFGSQVATQRTDVLDEQAIAKLLATTLDQFGGLDIVVSNAGNAPSGVLHSSAGAKALLQSLELNLLSHQRLAQQAAEIMIAQGTGGCLLFNASKSAFNPGPGFGPYAVPKAALVSLMKQYAIDLGSHKIRSNAINADRIHTRIFSDELLQSRAKARGVDVADYFKANLLSRETTAKDVAEAFCYLASAHAVTGAVLPVDGGNPAAFPR